MTLAARFRSWAHRSSVVDPTVWRARMDSRRTASIFGWLFIATFVLSIPVFIFFGPVLDTPSYITGRGG